MNEVVIVDRHGRLVPAEPQRDARQAVAGSPRIVQRVSTTGQADCVLPVPAPDIRHDEQFLHDSPFRLPLRPAEARPVPGLRPARASAGRAGRSIG